MRWLVHLLVSWLLKSVLVMVSVAAVSPKNPENTLSRALVVSLLVALLVSPFTGVAGIVFVLPFLLALIAYLVIYRVAYGVGSLQSFAAALVQAVLGFVLELFLSR